MRRNRNGTDTLACLQHSDLHQILQEWGNNEAKRPFVPGHEIVGLVVRVGNVAANSFRVNERVAVGTIVGSCGTCEQCSHGEESYCCELVDTYMGTHKATGERTYGGFAERIVVDYRFVYRLPESLPSTTAAPLMCAGITVYQPLVRHFRKGASIGVVGIGGLGHLALQFARALGYGRVVAITTTKSKGESAHEFGAQDVIVSSDPSAFKAAAQTLDVLLVTASADLPWEDYARLLKVGGELCLVGVPPSGKVTLPTSRFLHCRLSFSGSLAGGTKLTRAMLETATKHRVRVAVELYPLDAKGANEALERLHSNNARFRCVLMPESMLDAAQRELDERR